MSDVGYPTGDSGFEQFLEESARFEAAREDLSFTVNRFTLFLSQQGVIFEPEEFIGLAAIEENSVDSIHIYSMATGNKLHVINLACLKLMLNTVVERGGVIPENNKKYLQAQEIAKGSTKPWIELIDNEFPGEPLNDEDVHLFLEAVLEDEVLKENTNKQSAAGKELFLEFLMSIGKTDLTEAEVFAVQYMNFLCSGELGSRPDIQGSLRENAQVFAIQRGLDMGVWSKVIEHFFGSI